MKTFYWLLKRELWEQRGGLLWAPLCIAALTLLINIVGLVAITFDPHIQIHLQLHSAETFAINRDLVNPGIIHLINEAWYLMVISMASVVNLITGFVVLSYCISALYRDRRDRSILFWKSLPITDTSTVLSKVTIAAFLAPTFSVLTVMVTGAVMLALDDVYLIMRGVEIGQLMQSQDYLLHGIANPLGVILLHLLWALPAVGWLLLCSAWARIAPFLWALTIPAVAIALNFSVLALRTWNSTMMAFFELAGRMLFSVFPNKPSIGTTREEELIPGGFNSLNQSLDHHLLYSLDLWIGVIAGIAMIAMAIWLRRWRDER